MLSDPMNCPSMDYFSLSLQQLALITNKLDEAIAGRKLPLLPSFLHSFPTGREEGTFLGVDFGGTFFKFGLFTFNSSKKEYVNCKPFVQIPIPEWLKKASGKTLFEFIAKATMEFVGEGCSKEQPLKMGFTFSYPTRQTSLSQGFLLKWAKDIECEGVVGSDVVALLQHELDSLSGGAIQVCALLNDTVAAIMAYKYANPNVSVGCIFGTGTNGAYISSSCNEAINTEWGSFWNNVLPFTEADIQVDNASLYPGEQRFEKLISGRYLGEIAKEWMKLAGLQDEIPHDLDSKFLANLIQGQSDPCNYKGQTLRNVALELFNRAAKLGAAAIVATCRHAEQSVPGHVYVTVDGSLYTRCKYFGEIVAQTVALLAGPDLQIVLLDAGSHEEVSCLGAALAVAALPQ